MKISFEATPEEREQIVDHFEDYVSQHPVETIQDLSDAITEVMQVIYNSGIKTVSDAIGSCVGTTLEEGSSVFNALLSKFSDSEFESEIEKLEQKPKDSNKPIYITIPPNKYKS